ncbi:cation:proton antiporter [Streptomyces triticagri]|uniref:cation:proton antiporter n=1 Tax=Streptomyces triticagri TaxID=2293568 RepID=UPI001F2DEEAC|nr:cation:proton antiporter [Streptomyces triticagri]
MHDTTALLIELGAVILGLGLIGRFAGRIGLSPIPLYLLAGLAFGQGGLLPLDASEEFTMVGAEIGVILLLLLLGLEYTASELVTSLKTQYPSGAVDFCLNALPGAAAALILGWGPVGAVALAGVTWISSSGVIAKVLADLGRLGNRETPVILGVLVMEDLAMAVYLPLLTALLAGVSLAGGSIALVIALGTVGLVLYLALRHGRLISKAVSSDNPEMLLLVVLGLTLLVAGIAQELQVSAAVGAFLVGIALSGEVAEGARKLLTPLRDLFAAVFFVFFGLSTDPAEIPPVVLPALILALLTTGTKIYTGWFAAKRAGVGPRGRLRAGGTLVARGEFSIVIAGLAVGVEPRIGPIATAYVLLLVIIGPLAARWTEPFGRKLLKLDTKGGPAGAAKAQPVPAGGDPLAKESAAGGAQAGAAEPAGTESGATEAVGGESGAVESARTDGATAEVAEAAEAAEIERELAAERASVPSVREQESGGDPSSPSSSP